MAVGTVTQIAKSKAFGCDIIRFSHVSEELGGLETKWHAIVPCGCDQPLPVIYFLSGLTCTDENFVQKAGAARSVASHRVILIACDTSPRGANAPGEQDSWDFGTGAGFYVDAQSSPYSAHYRMYSFVSEELPFVVSKALGSRVDASRAGIMGHSMGGMGALVQALRRPQFYKSVSAFAPIAHPVACQWGKKCFGGYLGESLASKKKWNEYDPTELVKAKARASGPILIDQGEEDTFLRNGQLLPNDFKIACGESGQDVTLRMQPGYGHDYYFIQTFIDDHIAWHAKFLNKTL